jgi:hypothetical protein
MEDVDMSSLMVVSETNVDGSSVAGNKKNKKNVVGSIVAGSSVVGLSLATAAVVSGVRSRKVLKQIATNPIDLTTTSSFSPATIQKVIEEASRLLESTSSWKYFSILEVKVGGGTGAGLTDALDQFKAKNRDRVKLTVLQIQHAGCDAYIANDDNADDMFCFADISDFPRDRIFDLVVSTIPEQNLHAWPLGVIQAKLRSLVSSPGTLVRVRYIVQWSYVWWLLSRQRKIDLKATVEQYRKFEDSDKSERKFAFQKVRVRQNTPPVNVIFMRFS